MKVVFSFNLIQGKDDDLIKIIKEEQKKGLNLSQLIRTLLRHYYFGSDDEKTITKLKKDILEFENKIKEYEKQLAELKAQFESFKKVDIKKEENKLNDREIKIIEKIKEEYLDFIKEHIRRDGSKEELNNLLKQLISSFALKYKLSIPEAESLFNKAINIDTLIEERHKEVIKSLFYNIHELKKEEIISRLQRFSKMRNIPFEEAEKLFKEVFNYDLSNLQL